MERYNFLNWAVVLLHTLQFLQILEDLVVLSFKEPVNKFVKLLDRPWILWVNCQWPFGMYVWEVVSQEGRKGDVDPKSSMV